ncbi:unnamed protein product [Rhodiola kirilowii]
MSHYNVSQYHCFSVFHFVVSTLFLVWFLGMIKDQSSPWFMQVLVELSARYLTWFNISNSLIIHEGELYVSLVITFDNKLTTTCGV